MSLYKDASLVMIPSAYKDGKLYSIRPTDGGGDFTFSRGSNLAATRVDVNGLIEKGRENLLLQSNQFDTTWTTSAADLTSGQSGYNGSSNAWLLTAATPSGFSSRINQVLSTSASGVLNFSVYAKANTLDWILLDGRGTNGFAAWFDVRNGVKGQVTSTSIGSKITSVGNGWYRCEVFGNATTLTEVRIYVTDSNGTTTANDGDGCYIQDAQLEAGLVATDYIETGASTAQAGILEDMPRLDYSGSCPALLLEPQRTNLVSQSEFYGGSDWGKARCGFVTNTSETLSPEGLYNASKMTSTDINESYAQNDVVLGSTSGTYTFFAKKGDLDYCHALVWDRAANGRRQWFNLATGAVGTTTNFGSGYTKVDATIEDYGNGWYRCSFSWSGGNTTSGVRINLSSGDGVIGSPINSYGYFYGAQVEAGASYPTSYIPTYGSSVTRSKDATNVEDFSSFLTGKDVTYMFELRSNESLVRDDSSGNLIFQYDGGLANSFRVYRASSNSIKTTIVWFDGNTANNPAAYVINSATPKVAIRRIYSTGEWDVFVDGVKVYSATNTNFLNFTRIQLQGGGTPQEFKQFAVFDTALTDSECIALTTI